MSLRLSAIMFGVLWTVGMLWWNAPLDAPKIVIWSVAGVLTPLPVLADGLVAEIPSEMSSDEYRSR